LARPAISILFGLMLVCNCDAALYYKQSIDYNWAFDILPSDEQLGCGSRQQKMKMAVAKMH